MSKQKLRIGTRDSKLAVWQAEAVRTALATHGVAAELHMVEAEADLDLNTPLHAFGGTGIFTSMLDRALLQDEIDIAVHSLKDYPTRAPEHICIAAVLPRGPHEDILVHKGKTDFLSNEAPATIATGSIRRIAQWKSRYPHHTMTGLRGNVQTRLQKLADHPWQGAVFARAGLYRIDLLPAEHLILDWMIPAPAQGIIGIACREADDALRATLQKLDHRPTAICAAVERQFLNTAEGGCSAPIGALAQIQGSSLHFRAGIFAPDGQTKVCLDIEEDLEKFNDLGKQSALKVLVEGGAEIMNKIRANA